MSRSQIYYPTDFSPCAENALQYAIQIAKANKSDVEIIHEIDLPAGPSASMISKGSLGLQAILKEEANEKLVKIQEQLKHQGINSTTKIIFGNKLVEYLQNYEANQNTFVVMGTKGSSNAENRIFGSLTHKLIRELKSPILVVPFEAEFDGMKDILFAADYSEINKSQFEQLTEIGAYFDSNIHAVHVVSDEEKGNNIQLGKDLESSIKNSTSYKKIDFQMLYATNIEERLNSMIEEHNMSLLVLITKKRSFFERLFGQSLTKQMVYHTKIPMMIFQK